MPTEDTSLVIDLSITTLKQRKGLWCAFHPKKNEGVGGDIQ
jgi:hypothetical protein